MKCQLCSRELEPAETVWRYFESDPKWSRLLSICEQCFWKKERNFRDRISQRNNWGDWFGDYLKKHWREPLPCDHCARSIRIPRRYKLKLIVCGEACRRAIYAAQAKLRRAHYPEPCIVCGESFMPKRTDSRYCSSACRQAAYRNRVKLQPQV
jgi:hypothetical protein